LLNLVSSKTYNEFCASAVALEATGVACPGSS